MIRLYDPYGQLTAGVVAMQMHHDINRGSGRTTQMVIAAQETGGTIVANGKPAEYIRETIKGSAPRSIKGRLNVVSVDPRYPEEVHRSLRHGPLYMDHTWLFDYFMDSIIGQSDRLMSIIRRYPSPMNVYDRQMYDFGHSNPYIKIGGVP